MESGRVRLNRRAPEGERTTLAAGGGEGVREVSPCARETAEPRPLGCRSRLVAQGRRWETRRYLTRGGREGQPGGRSPVSARCPWLLPGSAVRVAESRREAPSSAGVLRWAPHRPLINAPAAAAAEGGPAPPSPSEARPAEPPATASPAGTRLAGVPALAACGVGPVRLSDPPGIIVIYFFFFFPQFDLTVCANPDGRLHLLSLISARLGKISPVGLTKLVFSNNQCRSGVWFCFQMVEAKKIMRERFCSPYLIRMSKRSPF